VGGEDGVLKGVGLRFCLVEGWAEGRFRCLRGEWVAGHRGVALNRGLKKKSASTGSDGRKTKEKNKKGVGGKEDIDTQKGQ